MKIEVPAAYHVMGSRSGVGTTKIGIDIVTVHQTSDLQNNYREKRQSTLLDTVRGTRRAIDGILEGAQETVNHLINQAIVDDFDGDDFVSNEDSFNQSVFFYMREAALVWPGELGPIRKAALLNSLWVRWEE